MSDHPLDRIRLFLHFDRVQISTADEVVVHEMTIDQARDLRRFLDAAIEGYQPVELDVHGHG